MASGNWRIAAGMMVVPVVVAGLAGCSNGGTKSAATTGAQATSAGASGSAFSATKLKDALLTHVNGATAAAPASIGKYSSLTQTSSGKLALSGVQVTPASCAQAVTKGFNPTTLAGSPAAAVTFEVGGNGVSEVLVSSSSSSASAALAGTVPAECAKYQETAKGKTYTYGVTEQPVTGVGMQAKALNVHAISPTSENLWSLIYRGAGFVGTVTVVGPNASEQTVQDLGKQAYAFASKTLS